MIPFYFPRQDSVGKSRDFLRAEGLSIAPNGVEVWATDSAGNLVFGATSGLQIQFATGTAALPGAAFAAQTGTGFFLTNTNRTGWSSAGVQALEFNSNGLDLIKNTSTIRLGASSDVILAWDAANTLALKNATAGQAFRVYGTTTGPVYLSISHNGTVGAITTNTGALNMGGAWQYTSAGHYVALVDNTYDFGASGAARVRDIFVGRSLGVSQAASGVTGVISVPTGGELRFGANSAILNVGDGILRLRNNGDSGFTRLIFGTNDTSGAAITKNSSGIDITDGSNANFTALRASSLSVATAGGGFGFGSKFSFFTAPTISSGFGTSPSVVASNGTAAFTVNVGTGGTASSGVIALPTAANGWIVTCQDLTTPGVNVTKMTANSATSATITNYNSTTGLAAAWGSGDVLYCTAVAY